MARPRKDAETPVRKRPPATTAEAREKRLIGLAVDLVEKKLVDGTASSQEITHLLKLATVKEAFERDKLQAEVKLLEARVAGMATSENSERLYAEAIKAMTQYKGEDEMDEYID